MNPVLSTNLAWIIAVLAHVAVCITALIIIPKRRKPTAAMAWLLAIVFLPVLGVVFYLVIGSAQLPKRRRAEQQRITALIAAAAAGLDLTPQRDSWPEWFTNVTRQNQLLGGIPVVGGNTATLLGDYRQTIESMATEIDTAVRFVHVEFFIVSFDDTTKSFFRAMEAAVARGVTVRLLADHVSSAKAVHSKETFAELDRIGVQWSYMLPVMPLKGKYQRPDLRNHRKLVVVDGRVGFMGSQNLIDRSYNTPKNLKRGLQWQELVTRLEGPVVTSLNVIFHSDWLIETGEHLDPASPTANVPIRDAAFDWSPDAVECQVVPSGPSYETENNLRLFLSLLYGASKRAIITSPYFVPDEAMMYAITSACQRGLDVQLFVSEIGDQGPVFHAQRSYYRDLLDAGVRIFRYPAPYILHAKHLSIDDDIAVIGSSNMDIRSFSLDLEISLLVRGRVFVQRMRDVEEEYRALSSELTREEWAREPLSSTSLDGVARLTSALE
ncbi:cardiolipin synthase [Cryobacterium adonitolivorans]|uniref:Cardiolipin synthase n=1 Tax=Cryobacterium adonitolivorans TaxID=1259189 RepID=A0A4R8WCR7_9MICO|nr:cardiolipin synthase [Cryobacterium adonitolivorans]TFC06901.1 cardiolipin synthase [Cryobacterium adonitolivorans]